MNWPNNQFRARSSCRANVRLVGRGCRRPSRSIACVSSIRAMGPSHPRRSACTMAAIPGRQRPTAALSAEGTIEAMRVEVLHGRILDLGLYAAIGTQKMQELTEEQRLRLARQVELVRSFSQRAVVRGFELVEGTAVVGRT